MTETCLTYELITPESSEDGDFADHGWIDPKDKRQRSLRKGGKRVYERHVRMAQRRRFDWRLRDAIEWLDSNNPGYCEGYLDSGRVLTSAESPDGKVRLVWTLTLRALADGDDIVMGRNGYEYGGRTNYELHFRTESHGSRERLCRVLAARFNVRRFDTCG